MCPQVFIIYNVLPGPRRAPVHGTCGGGVVIFHRFQAEKGMSKSRLKKSREAKKRRFCLADIRFHDAKRGAGHASGAFWPRHHGPIASRKHSHRVAIR
jgi:hypothetical protein